jgi:hypothetical protein
MRTLILYRSYYGTTKGVAEAMAGKLRSLGHDARVQDLRDGLPDLAGIDGVLLGAPTRMARVSMAARAALRRLRRRGLARRPIAIFDTYGPLPKTPEEMEKGRKWLEPGAAGILRQAAERLGLNVHMEVLRCEVKGLNGPLADGELEKAIAFVGRFAAGASAAAAAAPAKPAR